MTELNNLLGKVTLSQILAFFIIIGYLWKQLGSGYKKLTDFHDEIQKREQILSSIDSLAEQVTNVQIGLDNITKESREYRRTSLHDKITKAYIKYKAQGYITHSQLENFKMCLDKYYDVGGNGLVKNKIEKEVFDLEIKDE